MSRIIPKHLKNIQQLQRRKSTLAPDERRKFLRWYAEQASKWKINPDPYDPRHKYDYEAAWKAGKRGPDSSGHWPSDYKDPDHPNRYVKDKKGRIIDSITGEPK